MPKHQKRRGKRRGAVSAARLAALERALEAWEYRKRGYTFEQVANWCGYRSRQAAFQAVNRLRRRAAETAGQEQLDLYTARTEELWRVFWPLAEQGDSFAGQMCDKALDRMEKLYGFNRMPKAIPATADGDLPPQVGQALSWADVLAGAQQAGVGSPS